VSIRDTTRRTRVRDGRRRAVQPRGRPGVTGSLGDRPAHLRPGLIGVVLVGGAVGAALRYLVTQQWPTAPHGFPWETFAVNVTGSFCLGVLLEVLARAGADTGARRVVRLLLATGVLGAFTTYSALAVETDLLVRAHADARAAGYALASLAAGLLAAWTGIIAASPGHRRGRRRGRSPGRDGQPGADPAATGAVR